jgi:hypothetical protein
MWNTNVFLPPPLSARPPEAQDPRIVPNEPAVFTPISATYRYFDINGDEEDTDLTQIRWYINGVEIPYLRNLTEWNNTSNILDPIWGFAFSFAPEDVPANSTPEQFARDRAVEEARENNDEENADAYLESIVKVGDSVYFTVRPSDGSNLGDLIRSPSVTVVSAPPFVTQVSIKGRSSIGQLQDVVTTSTPAVADFNFFDDGNDNISTIIWYVNGTEFKRGNLNESVNGLSNNEILPGETSDNVLPIAIGNVLEVEIRPAAGNTVSDPIRSAPITVENAPPVVSSVIILPDSPSAASALDLSYQFFDNDIAQGAQSQQDESSIRWFRQRSGEAAFSEVASFANQTFVPAAATSAGDQWYAEVVPFDGISVGITVRSNTVTIQDS